MTTALDDLNRALLDALTTDARVYILGEDILDPYGGAFKVTRGLSSAFPERVITTPVSEAGVLGVATGMALRGLRPVVEIMFGDFTTLIADQLINSTAKFRWMYNDQVHVPVVIRTPMGGRRGYGPTHSQTLEKLYLGVPGLRTLAPSALGSPGELLTHAILSDDDPVLFIEHKLLYAQPIRDDQAPEDFTMGRTTPDNLPNTSEAGQAIPAYAPTYTLSLRDAPPPSLTLVAYGYMAELSRQAVFRLGYENEIFVELVVPTQLAPFQIDPILASATRTRRLLVAEEGNLTLGWGAEVIARVTEALGPDLQVARRLAAEETPNPAAPSLEQATLPSIEDLIQMAQAMGERR